MLPVRTRRVKNRLATAFRMAANALFKSQSWLGDSFRRMRAKLGAPKAITAAAHKLARIAYRLLATREPYDEAVFAKQERLARVRAEARLRTQAKRLVSRWFRLTPPSHKRDVFLRRCWRCWRYGRRLRSAAWA